MSLLACVGYAAALAMICLLVVGYVRWSDARLRRNPGFELVVAVRDEAVPHVAVVHIRGRIGDRSIILVHEQLQALLDQGPARWVLEVSGVSAWGDFGYDLPRNWHDQCCSRGGRIALAAVERKAAVVFEMLGVFKAIPHFDDVESAVRCVRGEPP